MPPYVLYSAKNLRVSWTEGGPDGSRYNVSDKGWLDQSCFHDWFCCHFIPFLSAARPVVLIFDGHASHLNPETIKEAVKNQVIIPKLPPNSTHFLQPLDVGVYGPAKTAWEAILVRFARQNLGVSLSKELFPSLLKSLWESESLSAHNVKAGFKKCEVIPLDASQISPSIYESAEFFDLLQQTPSPSSSNDSPPQPSTPSITTQTVDSAPQPSSPPTTTPAVVPSPQPSTSPSATPEDILFFFLLLPGICRLGIPLKTVDSGGTFQSLVWSHSFAAADHNHSSSSSEDARQICMAGPGHGCHLGMSDILATLRKLRSVAFHLAKAR
ncbi:Jerky protein [Plakobranchus ocellatus]|uniref:Jerky protein n=1 Tax=Plakobranchus ocellatus TaxID=259542 RepID=A0AAV4D2H4_9GAST|nr:Jerky protein [Plakobranchus ocellatus]